MAYTPPRAKVSYNRIDGLAKVEISTKTGRAKVTFKDNPTRSYIIDAENIQANPVWTGKGYASVSEDGRILYSMRPYSGIFDGKAIGIAKPENGVPTPKTQQGQYGDYQTFIGLVEIVGGKYAGCIYPTMLSYKLREYNGETALPGERGKYSSWDQLEDFLVLSGAFDSPLPWASDGNVLPEIDKRIRNSDSRFKFTVKDGYLDTFIYPDEDEASDDDDGWDEVVETEKAVENVPAEDEFD